MTGASSSSKWRHRKKLIAKVFNSDIKLTHDPVLMGFLKGKINMAAQSYGDLFSSQQKQTNQADVIFPSRLDE